MARATGPHQSSCASLLCTGGAVTSPMPGRVVKVLVKDGDKVGGWKGLGKGERRGRAHASRIAAGMCEAWSCTSSSHAQGCGSNICCLGIQKPLLHCSLVVQVAKGQPVVVIEAMKMEHQVGEARVPVY
jgi:hypothetical protein